MEELQNLIAHLKNQGLTDAKIPVDVWCGIIEYFANKQEAKQCNIADVSQRSELLPAFLERKGSEIITLKTAGTDISCDWHEYLKACNCG
jgi:hypothetical protein